MKRRARLGNHTHLQEILSQLERNEGRFPRIALQQAAVHREEIVPELLKVLEEVARDPQPFATNGGRMIHIYAMFLLAQFREPRAYPLLVKIEREHYPIDLPDPIEAIKFRLEQVGKDSRALIGVVGQRTRVYEVMRRKRPLSLNMIRNLHEKFGIPAEVLIQPTRRNHKVGVHGSGRGLRRGGMRSPA